MKAAIKQQKHPTVPKMAESREKQSKAARGSKKPPKVVENGLKKLEKKQKWPKKLKVAKEANTIEEKTPHIALHHRRSLAGPPPPVNEREGWGTPPPHTFKQWHGQNGPSSAWRGTWLKRLPPQLTDIPCWAILGQRLVQKESSKNLGPKFPKENFDLWAGLPSNPTVGRDPIGSWGGGAGGAPVAIPS